MYLSKTYLCINMSLRLGWVSKCLSLKSFVCSLGQPYWRCQRKLQGSCSSCLACHAPHIKRQLHSLLLYVRPLASWLSSFVIASADTTNLTTQSLSFVLLLGLIRDYSSVSLGLGYYSPCVLFPCSATAEARLVAFSLSLCNTSFIIKGQCSLGERKKKKK